jgi:uncharacterized membrane protein YfcA
MLPMAGTGDWLLGGLGAFLVTVVTTPAGVSGAVFLLPVQVSVLHVANPALTPTNLLYNVISTPGALLRFRRERRLGSPLTRALLAGTIPGVVLGAVVRVEVLSGPQMFLIVVAIVLAPLGAWLAVGRGSPPSPADRRPGPTVTACAFGAGLIGGVYGIGGGSLLRPLLAYMGFSLYVIAPAALTSTFVTSVAGVLAYQALELANGGGAIATEWPLGISMGLGGIRGSYLGARRQRRVPEEALRRLLGMVCLLLAARYAVQGAGVG